MQPVRNVFQDRVLVPKHNLNAQAVGRLRSELGSIERQTSALVKEMECSIDEADAFIERMQGDAKGD